MSPSNRTVPRPFTHPWGSGHVVEEASYSGLHHQPVIQLLEYDEGEAIGGLSIRFCFYSQDGHFRRSPLMVGEDDLDGLRAALTQTPRLSALLKRLVQEP